MTSPTAPTDFDIIYQGCTPDEIVLGEKLSDIVYVLKVIMSTDKSKNSTPAAESKEAKVPLVQGKLPEDELKFKLATTNFGSLLITYNFQTYTQTIRQNTTVNKQIITDRMKGFLGDQPPQFEQIVQATADNISEEIEMGGNCSLPYMFYGSISRVKPFAKMVVKIIKVNDDFGVNIIYFKTNSTREQWASLFGLVTGASFEIEMEFKEPKYLMPDEVLKAIVDKLKAKRERRIEQQN